MSLLVFGAGGQVGQELMALARARGVAAVGLAHADADICDASAVRAALARHRPHLVVNAAAYTAVDGAEREPDVAQAVNALAPGLIADAAAVHGAAMLHLSTDYVFDGSKDGAYTEDDPIAPLGIYGRSKAAGEAAVRDAAPRHVILRTAWVYGRYGANFLKTMLRLAAERDRLRVVADQVGCPTATQDIAAAILAVDAALTRDPAISGTFHVAGADIASWHGFAQAIVAARGEATGCVLPVDAIATADFPTPARRPAHSVLDSARFAATFGLRPAGLRHRTREVVMDLLRQDERTDR